LDEQDELLVGRDSEGHDATYIAGKNISTYGNKAVDLRLRNKIAVLNNLTGIYSSVSIVAIFMIESGDGRQARRQAGTQAGRQTGRQLGNMVKK
jgi:hypothetical protein